MAKYDWLIVVFGTLVTISIIGLAALVVIKFSTTTPVVAAAVLTAIAAVLTAVPPIIRALRGR